MTEEKKVTYKRRKFLIVPDFQLYMIAQIIFMSIFIVGVFYFFERNFLDSVINNQDRLAVASKAEIMQDLALLKEQSKKGFLLKSFCFVGLFSVWGLFLSHRISGPIYRIKKTMQENIEQNKKTPIRLRKKDFFHDLAGVINKFLQ